MNAKHRRTLEAVFAHPTRTDVAWADVESLFRALGAEVSQGRGSRVRVALGGRRAVFHQPHPQRTCLPAMVRAVRDFLIEAGVNKP
ncbi:MAG: type II toxin-antitoxin system HicA family toxin [Candidatus Hydrogenedentota bacterium]